MQFDFTNSEEIRPHLKLAQKSAISEVLMGIFEDLEAVGCRPEALASGLLDRLHWHWKSDPQAAILKQHLEAAIAQMDTRANLETSWRLPPDPTQPD